jgi:hypothetical protein
MLKINIIQKYKIDSLIIKTGTGSKVSSQITLGSLKGPKFG